MNSELLKTVWIMMFCRIEIAVPKPDRTMKIHARTVTKVDRCGFAVTTFPLRALTPELSRAAKRLRLE